ncbi:MAG: DUF89 family protein [Clostridia bacterium]|nr:DUF89 family protein [Clostridia bacterium]
MTPKTKPVTRLTSLCIACLAEKYLYKHPADASEEDIIRYRQAVCRTLAEATMDKSAPELVAQFTKAAKEIFGTVEDVSDAKRYFNDLMLARADALTASLNAADDPLRLALSYSMLGNYIDFGTVANIDEDKLSAMLDGAKNLTYSDREFARLKEDLARAKRLVFLTDNCGEIVLDKILITEILRAFPNIRAEAIVRGAPVLNDATIDDALQVRLPDLLPVSDNGSAIAGTCLTDISEATLEKLSQADIILAKGQANFETLRACGMNVYYIFMCKCKLFAVRFGVPMYSGMLLNDRSAGE